MGCCRYRPLFKNIFLSLLCCSSCPVVILWKKDPQWRL
ncbi:hypothetical protein N336_05374 [Phalacrocorax carbo]|uniref:Uncharacterized protein n=1 Tax=Phalacrocorax carbo TaxID=9209 RepID=A0A093QGL7_PHACA|nr:hypothetical protein N336_05374 [Phalacrocorax carbo]